ncbi:MAG: DUF4129 domain-containing protein [Saprospiraceae bacterium]|nr:DUF4129 domain-containing protein [Saprospiraceae bacterium]
MRIFFFLLLPLWLSAQSAAVADTAVLEEMVVDTLQETDLEADYDIEPRTPYTAPPVKPVAMREPKAADWDAASGEIDYSKDIPKPPKERKKRDFDNGASSVDWTRLTQGLGNILQVLAVLFALCVIAYGIYWMMQAPRNRVIARDGTEITLANLDEYIHETDLERYLREALIAANWPLAVRLYFLQAIKTLSEKETIVWSREKTNRDYLREMSHHHLGAQFRDITRHYERVWYGNQTLTSQEFKALEPKFKDFLNQI